MALPIKSKTKLKLCIFALTAGLLTACSESSSTHSISTLPEPEHQTSVEVTIPSEQSDQSDEDGSSNMDELITDTDLNIEEYGGLPVHDVRRMGLLFIANYFESPLPRIRPYMITETLGSRERSLSKESADIDIDGNGHLETYYASGIKTEDRSATRTSTKNNVRWEGTWRYYDDYSHTQQFTNDVSVEGDRYTLTEESSGNWIGTYDHFWRSSANISGELIEGTDYCKVIGGTITEVFKNGRSKVLTTRTLTKDTDQDLWHVLEISESEDSVNTSEYYARELSMHVVVFGYQRQMSKHDDFYCNYIDFRL